MLSVAPLLQKRERDRAPFFCRGRSSSSVQHYLWLASRFFSILRILSLLLPPSTWSHVERECRLPSLAARSLVGVPQTERQCPPPGTSVPMSDAAVASSVRILAAFRVRPLIKFELSGRKISSPSNSLTRSVCRLKNFKDLGAFCSLRPKTTTGSFRSCAAHAVNDAAEANPRLPSAWRRLLSRLGSWNLVHCEVCVDFVSSHNFRGHGYPSHGIARGLYFRSATKMFINTSLTNCVHAHNLFDVQKFSSRKFLVRQKVDGNSSKSCQKCHFWVAQKSSRGPSKIVQILTKNRKIDKNDVFLQVVEIRPSPEKPLLYGNSQLLRFFAAFCRYGLKK